MSPLSIAQIEQRRAAGRTRAAQLTFAERQRGGRANAARHFTPDHQRAARACVPAASSAAAGRKGGAATLAKYGKDFLLEKVQAWRLAHPSRAERALQGLVSTLGYRYTPEVPVGGYLVDVGDTDAPRPWGIECRGQWIHDTYGDPAQEAHRTAHLQACGYHLLIVPDTGLVDVRGVAQIAPTVYQAVAAFLARYGRRDDPASVDELTETPF